jgi:ribosomal protein S18 acetylase RimI-like enzyme
VPRFETRPYKGESDLALLLDFARTCTAEWWPRRTPWHVGDVAWQLLGSTGFDPFPNIRLWFEGGSVVGLGWFEPPLNVVFETRPVVEDQEGLMAEILDWAEERRRELARPAPGEIARAYAMLGDDTLATTALESDHRRIALLERRGYARGGRDNVHFRQSLAGPILEPPLEAGMRLRHATEADIEARAELHCAAWSVWGPSSFSVETYRRLRASPVYDEELDVILEAADGTLVSYCICWQDPANGVGTFEPVGTRPGYTGRGFQRATMYEGLRRLKQRGMHTALVGTASVNEAALALYPRCGFLPDGREWYFTKQM